MVCNTPLHSYLFNLLFQHRKYAQHALLQTPTTSTCNLLQALLQASYAHCTYMYMYAIGIFSCIIYFVFSFIVQQSVLRETSWAKDQTTNSQESSHYMHDNKTWLFTHCQGNQADRTAPFCLWGVSKFHALFVVIYKVLSADIFFRVSTLCKYIHIAL